MTVKLERKKRAERWQKALTQKPNFPARRAVLLVGLSVAFSAVLASAFYRQVLETDFLKHEGELRSVREREIPARRGMVMDRHGEPLAISTAVATLSIDPRSLLERPQAIEPLAQSLELDPTELKQRLEHYREKAFMYLRRRVEPRLVDAAEEVVRRYDVQGFGVETEYRRFYPGGEVFAHVLGFTDIDDQGQEGIELAYDQQLRAIPGKRRVIQDGRGRVVEEIEQIRAPRHGEDLLLSLDRRLQFLAYRELKRAVSQHQAVGGTAVLLDVDTGEVLAAASQPSFNPNAPRSELAAQRRNRVFTDLFEPGSTVKPLVIAMAMENGVINPGTAVDTGPGFLQVGRNRVRDVHNYGLLNATSVLTKSSNVGIVKIARQMDRALLWQLYDRVGFGQAVHWVGDEQPFPGTGSGFLPNFEGWSEFEHATLAFGYGLNVTTMQLASAYGVLAGDGVLRPVTLLRRDRGGEAQRVFSPRTMRDVRAMMETVVSPEGTARRAAVTGYRVAGKTGTAKKAGPHGYVDGRYQAVFAGMAPASAPRFVMVVMIDEPGGKQYYGGLVAAPVFAKVMEMALRLYNVPPDDPAASLLLTAGADSPAGAPR
ncbi:peptidoglycan D,D-transpeptidase FtsI family protein [Thiorhodovibrio frisius]|uniref:Peptidoglycan D,D-transpeptidase FtsI n=1 Tax=Thiorhodovibrio frisius TaxID=631362 RepID=H8Z3I9_9GAMM|nr:penicillin-binding transpeptidase domain-containing protein [Thiorhodovibrio frisius]EIC21897.1 cell division protein FtsI/penicillin-binding protein 2 [Thiorhodovibrio frisius]WPL24186.1 Peptidoglycan synthase FtsI precursor [Thiorhodovibrio frisius]